MNWYIGELVYWLIRELGRGWPPSWGIGVIGKMVYWLIVCTSPKLTDGIGGSRLWIEQWVSRRKRQGKTDVYALRSGSSNK